MSEHKNDGGAAFPRPLPDVEVTPDRALEIINEYSGMSLRDYFAGQALVGILSTAITPCLTGFENLEHSIAANSYNIADAMLERKSK